MQGALIAMSKILSAMKKSALETSGLSQRLRTIDRGNLFPSPDPEQVREFEQLASALVNLHSGDQGEVVVFAGTYTGEGSSYVSYNCAKCLALMLDQKVAWIDGNFASPFSKLNGQGLEFRRLLLDPDSMPDLGDDPEFVLIGNGEQRIKAADLLSGPSYSRLLMRLQETFRFTIIDAPPILDSVEATYLARKTLGLVLVVESQRLKYEIIQHGLEKLKAHDVPLLGTVLNKRRFQLPEFFYNRF